MGGGDDLVTSDPQSVPGPRGIINEGLESVNDEDRCLYVGTPWEAEVINDRRDLETFKEAARTIRTVLLVRTFAAPLGSCFGFLICVRFQWSSLFVE
jgi:hypothetical protein